MPRRNHVVLCIMLLIYSLAGCGSGGGSGGGRSVEEFPDEGNVVIAATQQPVYNTVPPTSGPHYPTASAPGFYDSPQPAGNLVHALYHSCIVLYYDRARLPASDIDALKALANQYKGAFDGVVVTPRADPQFALILTAWRHRLRLEGYDSAAIQDFLTQFRGKGPVKEAHTEKAAIETFPNEGHIHVADTVTPTYKTDPPTSGPHYRTPTAPGVYATAPKPGNLVHALEHSCVVLYYDPDRASTAVVDSLKEFADKHKEPFAGVIVVPRKDAKYVVIATAWQHRVQQEVYDKAQIEYFLSLYLGQGPERAPHTD